MKIIHENYMAVAVEEAHKARELDEVPVGAVLVNDAGDIIARAHNAPISRCDPSAHAEMLVLRLAAKQIQNYRLLATTLYVTVEPCVMCMGALIHARVAQVVFGAPDPKWGAVGSIYDFIGDNRFNHRIEIIAGIREAECRELMQGFFREKRTIAQHGQKPG